MIKLFPSGGVIGLGLGALALTRAAEEAGGGESVPVNGSLPGIEGTAKVGETLEVSDGGWMHSPTGFAFQWQRNDGEGWDDIEGATADLYEVVMEDVGCTLRAQVIASNAVGDSEPAFSLATGVVTDGNEVTRFDFNGFSFGSHLAGGEGLPGKYLLATIGGQRKAVWFRVDGAELQPDASGHGVDGYVQVDLVADDDPSQMAGGFAMATGGGQDPEDLGVVILTEPGDVPDAVDFDSGVGITVVQQGV